MRFKDVLLSSYKLEVGEEKRLFPGLDVSKWDRLHFHVGTDAVGMVGLAIRIIFGTPMAGTHCGALLADTVVWCEGQKVITEFSYEVPTSYDRTGLVITVPVVAPQLYDVILENKGTTPIDSLFVSLMSQEI